MSTVFIICYNVNCTLKNGKAVCVFYLQINKKGNTTEKRAVFSLFGKCCINDELSLLSSWGETCCELSASTTLNMSQNTQTGSCWLKDWNQEVEKKNPSAKLPTDTMETSCSSISLTHMHAQMHTQSKTSFTSSSLSLIARPNGASSLVHK